jgi:anti-sigma B factor antagonist
MNSPSTAQPCASSRWAATAESTPPERPTMMRHEGSTMSLTLHSSEKGDDAYVVYPAGSLSSDTAPDLERLLDELIAKEPRLIVLDLNQLKYISSAGIRVLLKAKKDLKGCGGSLSFMHLQPPIRKVFDIINALPSLQIFASIQELDDYLDSMQREAGAGPADRL